jgi:RNA polymerase sigma factor (sigma-70 family)
MVEGCSVQAEDEVQTAQRIQALERETRALLSDVTVAAPPRRRGRKGRTRAADVDRIEAALEAAKADPTVDRELVAHATALWDEAQALRWHLATSALDVARREARRLSRGAGSLSPTDLVQEGVLGLLAAAKRFEPDRGIRFGTYARWWARAAMTRAIDCSRVVRMSGAACEQLRNLRLQVRAVEGRGKSWSISEVAEAVGVDPEQARRLLHMTAEFSIDEQTDDEQPHASVTLADEDALPPDEAAAHREQIGIVLDALGTVLDERQRQVVVGRFGIGTRPGTLNEVAEGLSLSRERVRQIERESLDLLREACGAG